VSLRAVRGEAADNAVPATPEGTRAVLRRFGIHPSKRWGQHFLVSQRTLGRILDAADLSAADSVLEVGGGIGTLTGGLAARAGWVASIEVDARLLPALRAIAGSLPNVRIVAADARDADLGSLFEGPSAATRKVVANLPYNISAPMLMRMLDPGLRLSLIVVTVQREVAERIVAAPGTDAYGRLAIAVQYRSAARIVARVPPGAFLPTPNVESAIVKLVPRPRPAVAVPDEDEFFKIVAAGFGHRRKTLANALERRLGLTSARVEAACRLAGVDPRARAETLGLEAFAHLARELHPVLDPARRPV
jgi:16S rRNA (adenine1518-N6/adenine1519-N6)-dimethyltransferase